MNAPVGSARGGEVDWTTYISRRKEKLQGYLKKVEQRSWGTFFVKKKKKRKLR